MERDLLGFGRRVAQLASFGQCVSHCFRVILDGLDLGESARVHFVCRDRPVFHGPVILRRVESIGVLVLLAVVLFRTKGHWILLFEVLLRVLVWSVILLSEGLLSEVLLLGVELVTDEGHLMLLLVVQRSVMGWVEESGLFNASLPRSNLLVVVENLRLAQVALEQLGSSVLELTPILFSPHFCLWGRQDFSAWLLTALLTVASGHSFLRGLCVLGTFVRVGASERVRGTGWDSGDRQVRQGRRRQLVLRIFVLKPVHVVAVVWRALLVEVTFCHSST